MFVDIPAAAGAGRRLLADDMCLTFHHAFMIERTTLVNVQPIAVSSSDDRVRISVANLLRGDLTVMEAGLRSRSRGLRGSFLLAGENDHSRLAGVLDALHSSGA